MAALSAKQTRKLLSLIKEHVTAQADLSWKGSQPPGDWPLIEEEAQAAKKALKGFIASLRV